MQRKIFGYVKATIKEKNKEEQINKIKGYCESNCLEIHEREIIVDTISADNLKSDGYKALVEYMVRSGDVLVVSELDRLGRTSEAIRNEWKRLYENKIELAIVDNPVLSTIDKSEDEKEKVNEIVTEILSYLAMKEKKRNKERQSEGINKLRSKNDGKGIGRPKTKITREFKAQYKMWKNKKQSAVDTYTNLGLTKATFYRLVKEYESEKIV
ncbi:recombinase family protein [uncultured Clostridium sp.]|uniref:recombinase family protein n=1 Tax=uncultured Clostridium sp. TaxID=59620 RepID=UPI0025E3D16C|nr:recombinase family protein [uncultured Clostridium sp.]